MTLTFLGLLVLFLFYLIYKEIHKMSALSDAVEKQVQVNDNLIDSAIILFKQLSDALQAAVDNEDMSAVQAVIDELDAKDKNFADAIVANTPAAPKVAPAAPGAPVSADGTKNADGSDNAGHDTGTTIGTVGSTQDGTDPVPAASAQNLSGVGLVSTDKQIKSSN